MVGLDGVPVHVNDDGAAPAVVDPRAPSIPTTSALTAPSIVNRLKVDLR